MSRSIFRRIFIIHLVLAVSAFAFVEFYITSAVRQNHIDELVGNLQTQIKFIAHNLDFAGRDIDGYCKRIKTDTGARTTIISLDGTVIGDSDSAVTSMDNHIDRIEIRQAIAGGVGTAIRHSDTLKHDFLYVAIKSDKGFVRLAVSLNDVYAGVNDLRLKIIIVVISVLLATFLFFFYQTEKLRRFLLQTREFAHALAIGGIGGKLYISGAREFEELASDLNIMSMQLHAAFSSVEAERARLSAIFESIPVSLLIVDAKGVVLMSSRSANELFENTHMKDRRFIEIIRSHELSSLVEEVKIDLVSKSAELFINEKHLFVRVAPLLFKAGELSGFVLIFMDITHEKRLEAVRKDFVANISHELKTPITAIKGFSETLLGGAIDDPENAKGFLTTIHSHADRINNLIDDLMTISKIELGVIECVKSVVSVDETIEAVLQILAQKAEAKGLDIRKSISTDVCEISADKNRLIQIIMNLADNAIKFTEKGGVVIGTAKEDGIAYIFVEDTGIGIPQKHLSRIGERFYRVDPARSRIMGGTGLGLSIVKHLVKAHGWRMKIESTLDKGTKIKIYI